MEEHNKNNYKLTLGDFLHSRLYIKPEDIHQQLRQKNLKKTDFFNFFVRYIIPNFILKRKG